ncbi:hypothetical protein AB0A71_04860 [Kitasatospora aureofaciens]|uniref:hypothetical protein n=1 Tax=Kitasatospora aureofaciens TaxID=1894 RepID=UPI0033FADFEE
MAGLLIGASALDPPLETGWLPRPATYLDVLRQGESYDTRLEGQGYEIDPVGGVPFQLELLFRPFAPGSRRRGRRPRRARVDVRRSLVLERVRWRQPSIPSWPLALLFRNGEPTPEAVAAVAEATASGSHADEVRRWAELTHTEPTTPA